MAVKKQKAAAVPKWDAVPDHGVGRQNHEHNMVQAFVGQTDEVAVRMERKWGVDRLPRLVPADWADKFYSQAKKFNRAIHEGTVADVQVEAERMRNAWNYLDQLATQAGHQTIPVGEWWEVTLGNGDVVAFCRDWDEGRVALASGRKLKVYTLSEVARIAEGFPMLAEVKKHFPGAEVVNVRNPPGNPAYDWSRGCDVPFGD